MCVHTHTYARQGFCSPCQSSVDYGSTQNTQYALQVSRVFMVLKLDTTRKEKLVSLTLTFPSQSLAVCQRPSSLRPHSANQCRGFTHRHTTTFYVCGFHSALKINSDDGDVELNVLGCWVDILGTNCDQCRSTVQCCFTSTETVKLTRTGSPGRPPPLSHSS